MAAVIMGPTTYLAPLACEATPQYQITALVWMGLGPLNRTTSVAQPPNRFDIIAHICSNNVNADRWAQSVFRTRDKQKGATL